MPLTEASYDPTYFSVLGVWWILARAILSCRRTTNVEPDSRETGTPESSLAVIVKECVIPAVASVSEAPDAELIEAQISGERPAALTCIL